MERFKKWWEKWRRGLSWSPNAAVWEMGLLSKLIAHQIWKQKPQFSDHRNEYELLKQSHTDVIYPQLFKKYCSLNMTKLQSVLFPPQSNEFPGKQCFTHSYITYLSHILECIVKITWSKWSWLNLKRLNWTERTGNWLYYMLTHVMFRCYGSTSETGWSRAMIPSALL